MKILVTGATGFLGFRLIQRLQAEGHEVTATGRNPVMAKKIQRLGIPFEGGEIADSALLIRLAAGQEAVIHTAGLSSPWGRYADFLRSNLHGTEAVIEACFRQGVRRLVHVSTPSIYVCYQDRDNVRESDPLPAQFINAYAETKFLAEERVRAAQDRGLETVIIRPRALIGAGDTVIMPRLLRAQQEGRLRVIGSGRNRVDLTAVANGVDALILALHAGPEVLGQAFNITNGEPILLWEFLAQALERLGQKLNTRRIPYGLAFALAAGLEAVARLDPEFKEPALTRYSVTMLAKTQTLNIDKARQLLGYVPRQSIAEACDEFIQWWKQTHWL